MEYVIIDALGIAGFGYDFRSFDGHEPPILTGPACDSPDAYRPSSKFPILLRILFPRNKNRAGLRATLDLMACYLVNETRTPSALDLSTIDALVASEGRPSEKEISAQWTLIEMCKHPETQRRLREELLRFKGTDPTLDQLVAELPYLDAMVHEVFRTHTPAEESLIIVAAGDMVNSISEKFGGPTTKQFDPSRWLGEGTDGFRIHGYRHLLSFSDGPRACIEKDLALKNFEISGQTLRFLFETSHLSSLADPVPRWMCMWCFPSDPK
ncbi:cytochrome P450 [Mycena capillaripes]|nr:cytochrome P450 [Mycena capillaripes]